ncbi:MAG: pyrroloquinoline quinone biosynthesis peptide chaperone PqqD [Steroidobacteraceae bacterium]
MTDPEPNSTSARPRVAPLFRLQWEEAQQAHVLLFPEGMVKLNASAGHILLRCDGIKSAAEIIAELENAFATTGLGADVEAFLKVATDKGWVEWVDR